LPKKHRSLRLHAEPLPDQNNATEKTENERENETKPELAGSTASSNTSEDPSEPAANEGHIEVEVEEEKENVTAVEDEKPAREERPEPKREKKVSKKRSKKMEKKAKQLVEAVQRRKAIEERYFQHRLLKRTPSEEAFEKLMEKKDCTLAELTPEEKQVLMEHCHGKKRRDPIDEEWDRTMFARRKPKGPAFLRSRLRQKLQERRKDDDDDYLYSRAYKRRAPTPERPKTPEYTPLKSSDSPKITKRKPKHAKAAENAEINGTQEPLAPDTEKMNEVVEKLNKLGMEACMPKTEPMKSKVADAKKEDESKPPENMDTNHSPSESTTDSSGVLAVSIPKQQSEAETERRLVSPDEFHSLLVDQLKANREAEERETETPPPTTPPKIQATITEQEKQPDDSIVLPELENGEQPEERKTSLPNDEEGKEEEAGVDEKVGQLLEEEREAERREKKRHRRNERKKAIRQKKEEDQQAEQEKARLEQERAKIELEKAKAELERVKAEQESELTGKTAPEKTKPEPKRKSERPMVPMRLQLHNRKKPKNPEFNPKDYTEHQPLETLGMIPLMLTKAPCFITLEDMMAVESDKDDENSSPGCFVYRTSVENGGKDHPFVDIYLFARKRREDLDIIVEVSPIKAYRNHEDMLCLAGKPGRISYSCKLEISQLWTQVGE
jgi:hypothetical protein